MKISDFLKELVDKFGDRIVKLDQRSAKRLYVSISKESLRAFVIFCFKEKALRFNIASAVDTFEGFEVLYHFSDDRDDFIVTLRVLLTDREKPAIDTITNITRSAWWIEREIYELFGINFTGNADLRRLLLPDDWPDGVYPLRKDYISPKRDSRKA